MPMSPRKTCPLKAFALLYAQEEMLPSWICYLGLYTFLCPDKAKPGQRTRSQFPRFKIQVRILPTTQPLTISSSSLLLARKGSPILKEKPMAQTPSLNLHWKHSFSGRLSQAFSQWYADRCALLSNQLYFLGFFVRWAAQSAIFPILLLL